MSEASRASGRRANQGRVGTVVNGKWHIDARIGSGGMATVYAATHRNGGRAALKMLHTQLSRDEATRARFLREGYVGNAVGHSGVVHVRDDGVTEDGCAFLVLDLLEGETIESRRVRLGGMLPLDEVLEVADQALDALAAAHVKGIIHRDVKPDNVFLCTNGQVMLLDFGLAMMKTQQAEATKTGVTIGTPEFMAPEQASGRRDDVDARSDVWALGATLFTAITGKYVHDAHTLHEQLIASATLHARSIRELAPQVPAAVAVVIDRALELEMSHRWESAKEMQRALRAARVPRSDSEKVVAESLTMPAHSPRSLRNGANGVSEEPISGPRPSGPQGGRPVPSSDRTVQTIAAGAPLSDPTIEESVPTIILDSLPSSGPMTPQPTTERLTATGARAPMAVVHASPAIPPPLPTPTGPPYFAPPAPGPAPANGNRNGNGNGEMPSFDSTLECVQSPQGPILASPPVHGPGQPTLASATGSGPYAVISSSRVAHGAINPAAVIPARGSGSILPARPNVAVAPAPPAPPQAAPAAPAAQGPMIRTGPSSNPNDAPSPGPASLRQRKSARAVVWISLLLIAVCGVIGAWVLLHR